MNDPTPPGDLSAAQLFRQYRAFVARFLGRLRVPAEAIEDTVQDVFLVVHQRGGYQQGPAKPTTYLALIASRAASALRRRHRMLPTRAGNVELEELRAEGDDPAACVERSEDLRRLHDALDHLEPALRDTLLLAEFEEETAPAIAETMGVPVGTVYWRLHEARKKFQQALAVTDRSREQAAATQRRGGPHDSPTRAARLAGIFGLLVRKEGHPKNRSRDQRCPVACNQP